MKLKCAFAFVLAATLILAQPSDPDKTMGEFNGRFWNGSDSSLRTGYVLGYFAGFNYLKPWVDKSRRLQPIEFKGNPLVGEVVQGLTDFYKDPANVMIPIYAAMAWVTAKFNGRPQAELEALVEKQRKTFSQEPKP
jgi:hypothetical protein